MPRYQYWAKEGPSKKVKGEIEAGTEEQAIDQISRLGLLPLKIEVTTAAAKSKDLSKSFFSKRIKSKDITSFNRQLASFLKSGLTILDGLEIITAQTENPRLKTILENVKAAIKEGQIFSSILSKYPKLFSPIYIAMIQAGESGGSLSEVLIKLADYRQKQEEIVSKVKTALAYPAIMIIVAIGTIIFMFAFVMPRMIDNFSDTGTELPVITKTLLSLSEALRFSWPWIILLTAITAFIGRWQLKTKKGRKIFSKIKLKLPVFKKLFRQLEFARFSRTLEILLNNEISLLKAVKIATPALGNEFIKQEVARSSKYLEEGESFGKALQQSQIFPLFMINLLIIGESSGELTRSFAEIAETYERESEETIKIMTTLIEPLIILAVGLIVGFIVIAMLLPIFQMDLMV